MKGRGRRWAILAAVTAVVAAIGMAALLGEGTASSSEAKISGRSRRCVWQGAHAYARLRPVWSCLRGLCGGPFFCLADRRPRRTRGGRGDRYSCQSRPDWGHISAHGEEPGDWNMGGGLQAFIGQIRLPCRA